MILLEKHIAIPLRSIIENFKKEKKEKEGRKIFRIA